MSINSNQIVAALIGAAIGAGALAVYYSNSTDHASTEAHGEPQPLYWVAPMDANYRRDKPGKSPMGMDLVPVYEESGDGQNDPVGTVKIDPQVVNNLGVRTAKVSVKEMDSTISTVGYVQFDENQLVHIHPRVEGWIDQLFVKAAGDPVEKGQALYTLYSPQLVNAQEEFLIAQKRSNQSLIVAATERLQALQLSDKFIKTLKSTGKVRQNVTFYAPQSGVIDGLKVREGFYVKPGNTLMSIGRLDPIWVEAEVFERDAPAVQPGIPVTMSLGYLPGKQWQGMVDYVYPTLNANTRTLRVRLKFDNPEGQLKPNMFAQVDILAQSNVEAVVVPKEAVIRTGKQDRVVLARGDGKFKSVAVTIGRVNNDEIEILSGLEADDEVVTSAQFLIDSESSKNSDFARMSMDQMPQSLWLEGVITAIDESSRTVTIDHKSVPQWQWPEMVMDFTLAESVDMAQMEPGVSLHFETSKSDLIITGIHIMGKMEPEVASATVRGVINQIDPEARIVNISREAIEKWGRGPATMDFVLDSSLEVEKLQAGTSVIFTFEVGDDFVITEIQADLGDTHHD